MKPFSKILKNPYKPRKNLEKKTPKNSKSQKSRTLFWSDTSSFLATLSLI
jgi:hypothetical protein